MTSLRKTAIVSGAFYLLTFVSIPTLFLYGPVKEANFVVGPGPDTPVLVGGILEMIVALACIGTAVALFPVVKRQNEGMALGFVGVRVLEAGTIVLCVVSLLSIVTLRKDGAGADALVTGQALVAFHDWIFLLGQSFLPAVNALLLGTLLYGSRLVPSPAGLRRSGPAGGCLHRHVVRPLGTGVHAVGALRHPDRCVGVFAGRLSDRQGLQALPHHG
jgi:hypothetical protein